MRNQYQPQPYFIEPNLPIEVILAGNLFKMSEQVEDYFRVKFSQRSILYSPLGEVYSAMRMQANIWLSFSSSSEYPKELVQFLQQYSFFKCSTFNEVIKKSKAAQFSKVVLALTEECLEFYQQEVLENIKSKCFFYVLCIENDSPNSLRLTEPKIKYTRPHEIMKYMDQIVKIQSVRMLMPNVTFWTGSLRNALNIYRSNLIWLLLPQVRQKQSLFAFIQFVENSPELAKYVEGAETIHTFDSFKKMLEDNLKKRSPEDILRWYSAETFFYKIINRGLRILTDPTHIAFLRYATKEVYLSIQIIHSQQMKAQQYKKYREQGFSCFRGCDMSEQQIKGLRENIGGFIEMEGFLSTSLSKETSEVFGSVLVKIKVPAAPTDIASEGSCQGYAFISELSAHENEQQILFNPLNIFKVLKVSKYWNTTAQMECVIVELELTYIQKLKSNLSSSNLSHQSAQLEMVTFYEHTKPQLCKIWNQGQLLLYQGKLGAAIQFYSLAVSLSFVDFLNKTKTSKKSQFLFTAEQQQILEDWIGKIEISKINEMGRAEGVRAVKQFLLCCCDIGLHTYVSYWNFKIGSIYKKIKDAKAALVFYKFARVNLKMLKPSKSSLKSELNHKILKKNEIRVLRSISESYLLLEDYSRAAYYLSLALDSSPTHASEFLLADAGQIANILKKYEQALECYNKARKIIEAKYMRGQFNSEAYGGVILNISRILIYLYEDCDLGVQYLEGIKESFVNYSHSLPPVIRIQFELFFYDVHMHRKQYKRAVISLEAAYEVLAKIMGIRRGVYLIDEKIAEYLLKIGDRFKENQVFGLARKCYESYIVLYGESSYAKFSNVYVSLISILGDQKQFAQAFEVYQKLKQLDQRSSFLLHPLCLVSCMIELLLKKEKPASALQLCLRTKKEYSSAASTSISNLALINNNLGLIYSKLNMKQEELACYEEELKWWRKYHHDQVSWEQAANCKNRFCLYFDKKMYTHALNLLSKYFLYFHWNRISFPTALIDEKVSSSFALNILREIRKQGKMNCTDKNEEIGIMVDLILDESEQIAIPDGSSVDQLILGMKRKSTIITFAGVSLIFPELQVFSPQIEAKFLLWHSNNANDDDSRFFDFVKQRIKRKRREQPDDLLQILKPRIENVANLSHLLRPAFKYMQRANFNWQINYTNALKTSNFISFVQTANEMISEVSKKERDQFVTSIAIGIDRINSMNSPLLLEALIENIWQFLNKQEKDNLLPESLILILAFLATIPYSQNEQRIKQCYKIILPMLQSLSSNIGKDLFLIFSFYLQLKALTKAKQIKGSRDKWKCIKVVHRLLSKKCLYYQQFGAGSVIKKVSRLTKPQYAIFTPSAAFSKHEQSLISRVERKIKMAKLSKGAKNKEQVF